MRGSRVSPVHGASPLLLTLKGNLAGKAAAAVRRQRRAPLAALASWRAARRDGPPPGPGERRRYRALYLILCGPGELAELGDLLDSIEHYEDDDVKAMVVEDATPDVRWPVVRAHHPDADVLRRRGPPAARRASRLRSPAATGQRSHATTSTSCARSTRTRSSPATG